MRQVQADPDWEVKAARLKHVGLSPLPRPSPLRGLRWAPLQHVVLMVGGVSDQLLDQAIHSCKKIELEDLMRKAR